MFPRSMLRLRPILLLSLLAALAVAAPAFAQEPTPTPDAPLSNDFPGGEEEQDGGEQEAEPTPTPAGEEDEETGRGGDEPASEELADTGAEPVVVALGGLGLLLVGFGMRRTLAPGGRFAA